MRFLCGLAVFLSLSSGTAWAQTPAPDSYPQGVSFVDRFANLDSNRWYISNGWANGPHQNCTWSAANVKVANVLELSLTDRASPDRPFTCAELQTREFFGYGTYEVRMQPAASAGLVSAFFSFTGSPHGTGRPHNEIDFEFLGMSRAGVFLNYFAAGRGHESNIGLEFDATAAVQDYAFEWLPDSVRWFVNGRVVREVRKGDGYSIPTHKQKIYVSIWNGTGWDQEAWLGRFRYPGRPLVARYEYVAFTRMGDTCQFAESVACLQSPAPKR
jgi:endo-1,3-1,4-beta-glycanase ExoK